MSGGRPRALLVAVVCFSFVASGFPGANSAEEPRQADRPVPVAERSRQRAPAGPFYKAVYERPIRARFDWTRAFTPDVSIHGIEVTQAIQCFNPDDGLDDCADNSLPLVLDKPSAARIYLRYSSVQAPTLANVPVRLHIRAYGKNYTANVTGTARAELRQTNATDSANVFFTAFGGNTTVEFYAVVDPNNAIAESNETNNRYPPTGSIQVTFSNRRTLRITGRPLDYHPSGATRRQASGWAVNGGAATWFEQLLPIRQNGVAYTNGGLYDWTTSLTDDGDHTLIRSLNAGWILQLVRKALFGGAPVPHHVYGWTPNAVYSGGHADMPVYPHAGGLGVVAIGTDDPGTNTDNPGRGALILGHELVHDYDVKHTDTADSCGSSDDSTEWPYPTSSIQEFGFNPITGKVYTPSATHDIMSYCPGNSTEGWISPYTWNVMYGKLNPAGASRRPTARMGLPGDGATDTQAEESLLVNATILQQGGGSLGTMHHVGEGLHYNPLSDEKGRYSIVLRAGQETLREERFTVDFSSEYDRPDRDQADISMAIPWAEGTTSIALLRGSEVLDQRDVSRSDPGVRIVDPSGGEVWKRGTRQRIRWNASDPDGGRLRYTVMFSRDGGKKWQLLATELGRRYLDVEVNKLAGGALLFQVLATDGVRIATAETSRPVRVPNKAPKAIILNPRGGARVPFRDLLLLEGQAVDLENGNLADARLDWFDGRKKLGEGTVLPVPRLAPGAHLIRLQSTDANGETSSARARIFVTRVEPPRVRPEPSSAGQRVTASAAITDPHPSGGPYVCSIDWGDGTEPSSRRVARGPCTGAHRYRAAGTYTVVVSVRAGTADVGTGFKNHRVTG